MSYNSILNHPLISARYFFPRREIINNPFYVDCGEARLSCYYHQKYPGAKTIVHFHGNGEVVTDQLYSFLPMFDRMGLNIFFAEYRGYGMSTGKPELIKMLDDVEHIIKAIGILPQEMILFGRSVGSVFAVEAVNKFPKSCGLIIESGIADVLKRIEMRVNFSELGVSKAEMIAEVSKYLNHQKKLAGYKNPVLIMHTLHDDLVPVENARLLEQWANKPVSLHIFERGNHNTIFQVNADAYFRTVKKFCDNLASPLK